MLFAGQDGRNDFQSPIKVYVKNSSAHIKKSLREWIWQLVFFLCQVLSYGSHFLLRVLLPYEWGKQKIYFYAYLDVFESARDRFSSPALIDELWSFLGGWQPCIGIAWSICCMRCVSKNYPAAQSTCWGTWIILWKFFTLSYCFVLGQKQKESQCFYLCLLIA